MNRGSRSRASCRAWLRAGSKRFDTVEEIAGVMPDLRIDADDARAIAIEFARQ